MSPIWIALIIVAGLGLIFTIFTPGPDKAFVFVLWDPFEHLAATDLYILYTALTESSFGLLVSVYYYCPYSTLIPQRPPVFCLSRRSAISFFDNTSCDCLNEQIQYDSKPRHVFQI
jgi:hypothetical protein